MATTSEQTGRSVDEVTAAITQVAEGNERQAQSIAEARRVADEVATAADSGAAIAQATASAVQPRAWRRWTRWSGAGDPSSG